MERRLSYQELSAVLETVQELKVTRFQAVEDENKSNLDVSENDLNSRIRKSPLKHTQQA